MKCMEKEIDFLINKPVITPVKIDNRSLNIVRSYTLLGLWFDDDPKWKTYTEYITKKGAKRLYLLKILRSYKPLKDALKRFYIGVVRAVYRAWSSSMGQ